MKKLFTLLLSITMVVAANAADKFAQGPITWSAGPWYDAATGGAATTSPVAGDNVFTQGFAVTVSENATCDNLTYTAVAGQLILADGVKLTVRGQINCATAITTINVFAGSHDNSTVELTGAISPFPTGNVLITPNATNGMSANNIIINTTPGTTPNTTQYTFDANNNSPAAGVRTGTFTVKAGSNFKMTTREFSVGTLIGNGLIVEEGAIFTAGGTIRGTGNSNAATFITVNGTLESTFHVNAKTLTLGTNGVLRTAKSDRTTVTTPDSYSSDGWWGYLTSAVTAPATIFDKYVTPTTLNFATNATNEFYKAGNQNVPGTVAISSIGSPATYPIPYANIKLSGTGIKTIQSNLTATGNLIVGSGITLATATSVTATVNGVLLNLGTITGTVTNAKTINVSSDVLMGTVSGSVAGSVVSLVATPLVGYQFVNWTEASNVISTSATLPAFTAADGVRTIVANWSVATGLNDIKNSAYVTVEGSTLRLNGNVTDVEVFDAQGRRLVSERNVTSVNVKGNGIYIVRMHTAQGVNTQKVNIR